MKNILKGCIPLLLIIGAFTACEQTNSKPMNKQMREMKKSYFGNWKVKDKEGEPFYITISPTGGARSTYDHGEKGKWVFKDEQIIITWTDGWKTKIYKYNKKYKKRAYPPGTAIDGRPSSSSMAEKITKIPSK